MTALNTANSHVGDLVTMEVVDDVSLNGQVVIYRDAIVMGKVTTAKTARRMGRSGKLAVEIQTVKAIDGSAIPVVAATTASGKGGYGAGSAVGMTATVLVFWPATPLWLLKHGHDTEIPYGTISTIQVARDSMVDLARATTAPRTPPPAVLVHESQQLGIEPARPVRGETISGPGSDVDTAQESLGDAARREKAKKAAKPDK
jgi:hypothetical protein